MNSDRYFKRWLKYTAIAMLISGVLGGCMSYLFPEYGMALAVGLGFVVGTVAGVKAAFDGFEDL